MDLHFGLTNHRTTFCRYLRKTPFERMNRHFGMMNTPTMFIRCFGKTLGSEGFWFSCRTSSAKTPFKQRSAVSWQNRSDEQIYEFCRFLTREWRGGRHHSYAVPSRGKLSAWSRAINGKWSASGLADAASKYAWNGKSFSENKVELDRMAADLQSAVHRNSTNHLSEAIRAIMHWGGVDNKHRQKGTLEWIERNVDELSVKLSNAVDLIKDPQASLDPFDGANLI